MNDSYYEQLVPRKPKSTDMLIRILVIAVIILVAFFGMMFLGFLAFIIAILLAVGACYFVFPRLNVEYEYMLVNHDMEISAIYNKANRKKKLSFDIQQAEVIAPKGSHRLDSYRPEKTYDFSSGSADAKTFAVLVPIEQQMVCVLIDPDKTLSDHIRNWTGMKYFND